MRALYFSLLAAFVSSALATTPSGHSSGRLPRRSNTTSGKLRGVIENSGICETTPDVYQASGYGDIANNQSIWFWFFEARQSADEAPLVVWINGGPGSSSMLGLFQEIGPCRLNNDTFDVGPNPTSWTNVANILFVDQPVGTGFSYGDTIVNTTQQAAADFWKFLQIWFTDSRFEKYAARDFGLFTESYVTPAFDNGVDIPALIPNAYSYGGHYGPGFSSYFLQQNAAIQSGNIKGVTINLKSLGIGDGITDALSQYPGYLDYAANNPYHPLANESQIAEARNYLYEDGGCYNQTLACYNNGTDFECEQAMGFCLSLVVDPLISNVNDDIYYILAENPDAYPPDPTTYLSNETVTSKIGAQAPWVGASVDVHTNFVNSGDWSRNFGPDLERVIDAGVHTVIYAGDADFDGNFKGVELMVDNLKTRFAAEYAHKEFANLTVSGRVAGQYKTAGTFSYVRFFGAGHMVPAYAAGATPRGTAALQMFSQIIAGQPVSGT
ncbi:serine carboxypeptidase [Gloeopeniophorella convolvens]|nr:serine carboxypeptidase [Gloeopeniophorella convolvens]